MTDSDKKKGELQSEESEERLKNKEKEEYKDQNDSSRESIHVPEKDRDLNLISESNDNSMKGLRKNLLNLFVEMPQSISKISQISSDLQDAIESLNNLPSINEDLTREIRELIEEITSSITRISIILMKSKFKIEKERDSLEESEIVSLTETFILSFSEIEEMFLKVSKVFPKIASQFKKTSALFNNKENELKNQIMEIEKEKERSSKYINIHQIESNKLRGLSLIDKILTLIEDIKSSIIVINSLEQMVQKYADVGSLNNISKKIIRHFGVYEMRISDARIAQAKITLILKYLMGLRDLAEKKKRFLTPLEERSFYKARGLLKALHFRFDIFDNHILSNTSSPIEIKRIFSALEPTISNLSALEDTLQVYENYDKIVASFKSFSLDDKIKFMQSFFRSDFVDYLDNSTKSEIFIKLLSQIILTPEQVLDQVSKWERLNPTYRKKFVSYLSTTLVPSEKQKIISSMEE